MMETFSNLGSSGSGFTYLGPALGSLGSLWQRFLGFCWSLSMVAFVIAFPEPAPLDRRRPWVKWLLFVPLLGVALINSGVSLAVANFAWGAPFRTVDLWLDRATLILVSASVSIFFWALGSKLGTTKNPDSLRRLRILLIGSAVGMTPAAAMALIALATGQRYARGVPDLVNLIAILMMLILPLTLAYVVIVHTATSRPARWWPGS